MVKKHHLQQMVRGTGLEPVTPTVSRWCSTTELTALVNVAAGENTLVLALLAILFFDSVHFPLRIAIVIQKTAFREQREILQVSC
jgi:hypothetical protein